MHACFEAISAQDWSENSARVWLAFAALIGCVFVVGVVSIWRSVAGAEKPATEVTIDQALKVLSQPRPVLDMPGTWVRYSAKPQVCEPPREGGPIRVGGESAEEAAAAERQMRRAR